MSNTKWVSLDDVMNDDTDEFEIDLELDDNEIVNTEPDNKNEKTEEVDESTEEIEEDSEESEETAEKPEKRRKTRGGRAEKRIRQLLDSNKNLKSQLEQYDSRFKQLESKFDSDKQTSQIDTQITELEKKLLDAKRRLAKAKEENDYSAEADAQADITEATFDIRLAKAQKMSQKSVVEEKKPVQQEQSLEQPDAFLDWSEDNEWFEQPTNKHERKLRRFVQKKAKELSEDGVDWTSDDFYTDLDDEIDEYLKKNNLEKNEDGELVEKTVKTSKKTSPVAQESRSSTKNSGVRTVNGKKRISLSASEREMADRLGVSYQDYAKEKLKLSKSDGGYVSAFGE